MTEPTRSESMEESCGRTLTDLGGRDPNLFALSGDPEDVNVVRPFGKRFPDRYLDLPHQEATMMSAATGLALRGRTVYASTRAVSAAGPGYPALRSTACHFRARVKVIATHGGLGAGGVGGSHPVLEDIGLMRGLPGMMVLVPADAPSAQIALLAIHSREGPAYLRLAAGRVPNVTDGSFQVGHAPELRAGSDLTIIAVGPLVARALEAAEALARVGVSTRVLDFASVKPFDEPSLLRAARDTGALLVLEDHSVLTGVGALVASTTSENYPVPVRRVGVADLLGEFEGPASPSERYGLATERVRDEAWELLRLRGKVQ
ncbi:MAG: transketolase family protein [Thermoplasmata archaeon]|nr:transketolase family protein [Thermoplasmata archaeon]